MGRATDVPTYARTSAVASVPVNVAADTATSGVLLRLSAGLSAEGTVVHAATDAINSRTWGAAGKSFPGEGVSAKAVDTTAVAIVPAISL